MSTVELSVLGGPQVTVPWFQNMNAQQALESAYNQIGNNSTFTYALQYYGSGLGYLVMMINETYDSFMSSSAPFFYWQFLINGQPASTGIDGTILNSGDQVAFEFEMYSPESHAKTTVEAKHRAQISATGGKQ
jgi:hypothetical protein